MKMTKDEWKRMMDRYLVSSSRLNELVQLGTIDVYDYHLIFESLDDCYELIQAKRQDTELQEEL